MTAQNPCRQDLSCDSILLVSIVLVEDSEPCWFNKALLHSNMELMVLAGGSNSREANPACPTLLLFSPGMKYALEASKAQGMN